MSAVNDTAPSALASPDGPGITGRVHGFLSRIPAWTLWAMVILWSIPTTGLFVNSFRTRDTQRSSGWWDNWVGADWTVDNYKDVLNAEATGGLQTGVLNSFAIAIPATVIPIAIACFAAYAFAWMDFRGRHLLFIAVVSLLAIPNQVALVPLLTMFANGAHYTIPLLDKTITVFPDLNLSGKAASVWLSHTAFGLPFAIFLLHNYISSLPKDIFEAARIDGADHFTIFWRLVLPLSVPVIAAFTIFQFLWTWNDYLIALTMLGGNLENWPATIIIASQTGEFGRLEHLLSAGAFVQSAVPIAVFFGLQKFFVRGMLAGSVKG
jgi:alpha-glucoside transport system permease protein